MNRLVLAVSVAVLGLAVVAHGQRPEIIDELGMSMPTLVKRVEPIYSPEAMSAKLAGYVHVNAVVLPNGSLDNVRVMKSCLGRDTTPEARVPVTFPCVEPPTNPKSTDIDVSLGLNDAAVDAVKKWTFQPGRKNGEAVATKVELVLMFKLH
jgi:Gram-negative bacterial TonB protein C-terminal